MRLAVPGFTVTIILDVMARGQKVRQHRRESRRESEPLPERHDLAIGVRSQNREPLRVRDRTHHRPTRAILVTPTPSSG
jgi:hypothetical protein